MVFASCNSVSPLQLYCSYHVHVKQQEKKKKVLQVGIFDVVRSLSFLHVFFFSKHPALALIRQEQMSHFYFSPQR